MPYGLKDIELAKLNEVFAANERIERVVLYGSRAKGNYKPFSDVDITLEGDELTHTDLSRLSLAIDDLLLPYQFDISIFHTLNNEALIDHIRRMGITIYEKKSEWKEYKLGEIGVVITGKTPSARNPEDWGDEVLFVTPSDFRNYGKYANNSERKLSNIGAKRLVNKMLPPKSILVTCIGSDMGKVVMSKTNCITNQQINALIPDKQFDNDFLYYSLISIYDTLRIMGGDGTAVPIVNKGDFEKIVLSIPSLDEQRRIAAILSSLDDKIDLLHRENATLEQMAETLFRQWFVVEAKEEWEEKELREIVDISIGRTPPRKETKWFSTNPSDVKWLSIKDMGAGDVFLFNTSEYLTKEAVETFSIPIIPKNTVVLSFKMTVGRVGITTEDMLSNEAIAHFKFTNKTPITKEYLYLFLKSFKYDSLGSTSSIVTAINSAMIKDMMISIPDVRTIDSFKKQTQTIFDKIYSNQKQIQTLIQTRDELLPRLMSDEIVL